VERGGERSVIEEVEALDLVLAPVVVLGEVHALLVAVGLPVVLAVVLPAECSPDRVRAATVVESL
jgi:hypothetical protein